MSRKIIPIMFAVVIAFSFAFVIIASAQLADTPWPMFHQDINHTGQSPYLGAQTNYSKWNYTTNGDVISSPAIASDGTIYVGSKDKKLYAFYPNGTEKWNFPTSGNVYSSPAIASDGTIYVGSNDNKLYAINPDGTQKWNFSTGYYVYYSPAIASDGTIYVGSWDDKLYAINPTDGTEKWNFSTSGDVTSPAIASDGTIYVGSGDDKLYAINPDGTPKWNFSTGGAVRSSPAIASDGTIYVGSFNNKLCAINPDGTPKWNFSTGNRVDSSPAIASDGTIYVGSLDKKLYAINHTDGTEKWSFSTGYYVISSPAIASDGTIYVGSYDNKLYAIKPDGTPKWNFSTDNYVYSSPAIASDGTIYVGSFDNKLYALGGISKLVFTTSAQTITAGQASGVITIQTQDSASNPHPVGVDTTINLASTSATGKFSSSASPWVDITSVTISAGSNSVSFYYKDTTVGTPTITASESPDRAWSDAQQIETTICGDICVNETGWWRADADFNATNTPVQHAINNATAGDTICVKDGTYEENVDVNKRLTIRSENGSASTIVNASSSSDHVFDVTANYVNISGFNVTGATGSGKAGIYLGDSVDHCNVSDNNASNNYYGIFLYISSNNTLTNNTVTSCTADGIRLQDSSNNTLTDNTVTTVSWNGIRLYSSSNNNTLTNNTASNNGRGINFESSNNNTLTNNTASNNTQYDFYSDENSLDNTVGDLTIGSIASCPTTISFTYDQGIKIKGVTTPEQDPAGKLNISKFVNATNVTANSWIFLNVSYTDDDVSDVEEDSLLLYRWNGTAWKLANETGKPNGVNTTGNYVYANITSFSQIAPFGNPPDTTPPAITIDTPTESEPVYRKGGVLFYVNFTYTEENPKNYTVKIYNSSAVINTSSDDYPAGGANKVLNVSFHMNASAADGKYNVSVEMYDNSSNYNISYQNESVVKGIYNASISQPANQTTSPNVNATYELKITNTGNFTDTFSLAVIPIDSVDVAALNKTTLTNLDVGESQNVTLNVTDADEGAYNVTVNVTSAGSGTEVANTSYIMITVYEPTAPASPRPRGGGRKQPVLPSGVTTVLSEPTGKVASSVTASSADKKAVATIPAGAIAKDATGNPLAQVKIVPPQILPAPLPSGTEFEGYAYDFRPTGATFNPPIEIHITFDTAKCGCSKPVIYVYEEGWNRLETTVVENTATAKVDHFSTHILCCDLELETPTPTPSPAPAPTLMPSPAPTPTLISAPAAPAPKVQKFLVLIVIVVIVIAGIIAIVLKRK